MHFNIYILKIEKQSPFNLICLEYIFYILCMSLEITLKTIIIQNRK